MFTGLIETTGKVVSLEKKGEQATLTLHCPKLAQEAIIGESIAINGCCLTVTSATSERLTFDLLMQTLRVTSLGQLDSGKLVNMERALRAQDRLGGHFVQGHVDAVGSILDLSPKGQDHRLEIQLPSEIRRYCIPKGSLAIDGISLTIAELTDHSAVFWIIPHTIAETHLCDRKENDLVNLEADLLAKYVEQLIPHQ